MQRLPPPRPPREAERSPTFSATQQRLEHHYAKKLFDSADYFSIAPDQRPSSNESMSAFDRVNQEATRLSGQQPRSSNLSFEFFKSAPGGEDSFETYSAPSVDEEDMLSTTRARRGSLEDFFVEENEHATVKHALMEKPKLKRWDSGDFYSSPEGYRNMLATQAKEVLRNALESAEQDHRHTRRRRSSLSHEVKPNAAKEE